MIPWWGKIAAKMVLSRVPLGPALWRAIGVFRPGAMDRPDYAYGVYMEHLARAAITPAPGFVCLELGPGDSLFSAVLTKALGGRSVLVDVGPFAVEDVAPYRGMAQYLRDEGLPAPDLSQAGSLADVLAACDASYHPQGLDALRALETASVDFMFSQAVLEHVRRRDFAATLGELRRILKPGGVASHRVDLRDHLGGGLNNLRFSERVWEHDGVAASGFYTNRIGFDAMIEAFSGAGFAITLCKVDRWSALPTPRRALAEPFRSMDDDTLRVSGFDVILRPPEAA